MANPKFNNIPLSGTAVSLIKSSIIKTAIPNIETDIKDHDSYLGTPVYDYVTLGKLIEENVYYDLQGNKLTYNAISFDEIVLDVSQTKNISSMPIQGKNGTFKQYISDGDYVINISGTISALFNGKSWRKNGKYYPETELITLVNICKAGYTIPITSLFLNRVFGIDNIVITDYKLPVTEGNRYSQTFELNCLSDTDTILEFTEEEVNDSDRLSEILNS